MKTLGWVLAAALVSTLTFAAPAQAQTHRDSTSWVRAEALKVHTMAELNAAPPAVRAYLQTPAYVTHSVKAGTSNGPAELASIPCWSDGCGWSALPYPGCWWWNNYWTWTNAVGWSLFTLGWTVGDYCWDWASRFYATPTVGAYASTHWGWTYCGTEADFHGWRSYLWSWQDSGDFKVALGTCAYPDPNTKNVLDQLWGNGHYNWTASG